MALEWPNIGQDLLPGLQKHFISPTHFDAAFETDLGAAELLRSLFPDMVPEDVMDLVALLMVWKEDSERFCKRARLDVVNHAMYVPLTSPGDSVQGAYKKLTQTNVLTLIESFSKKRQRILRLEAESRSKRADVERRKYSLLLSQVIIDAELPVVGLIQSLDNPEQGWLHLFGTRRCNTLKNRYKAWKPFAVWLELRHGRKFPVQLRDIIVVSCNVAREII